MYSELIQNAIKTERDHIMKLLNSSKLPQQSITP